MTTTPALAGRSPLLPAGRAAALAGAALVACAAGAGVAAAPRTALLVTAVLVLGAGVALHPPLAAYLLLGVTPLVVGIDRGTLVPVLRPHEALLALCAAALLVRGVLELRTGARPRFRPGPVLVLVVAMAVANSVVPLLWMALRHQPVSADDLSYAVVLWKFLALYAVVRASVRTDAEVARCLVVAIGVGAVVAVVAILQALQLLGVDALLHGLFAPYGDTSVVSAGRGTATLGLAVATGDLMIFNLALTVGLWRRGRHRTWLLAPLALLFVAGTVAAGQFSTAVGLVVATVVLGVVLRRADIAIALGAAGVAAGAALAPVVATRLAGFAGASGLPESWVGRLDNLRGYFWPRLLEHHDYLLGVRPAARVPSPDSLALPWIWIESGYTWLFWGGGVPLFAAFVLFVVVATRRALPLARGPGALGVAATGVVVAVPVVAVLMIFDPHLTYRGSADLLFALLAVVAALGGDAPAGASRRGPVDPPVPETEVAP